MDRPIVVKIGGATLGSHDTTLEDIVQLQKHGKPLVVVHGGGKIITDWLKKQGVETKFVRGERVTDKASLDVATAVLAGLTNKEIVAAINTLGGRAVGISGVDGSLVQGKIGDVEMGYVGVVVKVDAEPIEVLLRAGYVPVVAPVSLHAYDRSPDAPQVLNVNADLVAGEIATAVKAERLVFLTDVAGISDKSGKLLERLTAKEAETLISSGVASGGMIPKIKACLKALATTPVTRIVDGRQRHALFNEIGGRGGGTTIYEG
jgi:acetylglutamate kinase